MPIGVVGLNKPKTKPKAPVKFKPGTKFIVVGSELDRVLLHQHTKVDENGVASIETIDVTGVNTLEELEAAGINVANWVERELIAEYNKYRPGDFHRLDERSYAGRIDSVPKSASE